MDGLKPGRGSYSNRPHARPAVHASQFQSVSQEKARHSGEKYWLVRSIGKTASKQRKTLWKKFQQTEFAKWPDRSIWNRVFALATLVLFIISTLALTIQPFLDDKFYGVTEAARSVLPEPNDNVAKYLKYNAKDKKFLLNEGYTGSTGALSKVGQGEPRITATFAKEPRDGVTVTDPLNKVDFTVKPKFQLSVGKQDRNQIFYPLTKATGYLVYTSQIASVKEDIVLERAGSDRMAFEYELDLANGLEARLEKNGSVGIYGTSLPLNGNVATGSEKDAELLQKTRENAKKDKFLFGIPAPVVVEAGKEKSSVRSYFKLEGNKLAVISEGLKGANYPLSIDPSVYVQSAAQLMRGNNESNVEFDVTTEQFKKGTTTGARIDEWTQAGAMNDATYDQAVAAAGGYVYRAGGRSGRIIPYVADSITTVGGTASTSQVINMPSYRPAGVMYVVLIGYDANSSEVPPGTWTYIGGSTNGTRAYYRIGGANEPASYTWTTPGARQFAAVVYRIGNADTTAAPTSASRVGGAGTTPVFNGVIPTQDGSLVLGVVSTNGDAFSPRGYSPTGFSDVTSAHSTGITASGTAGLIVSSLDSPPLSGVSTSAATTRVGNTTYSWGNVTIAIYGVTATAANQNSVQWAHFNGTSGGIESPAPGSNGTACSNWCTDSAYNLPPGSGASDGAGTIGGSMVAYNGYLYYTGGSDGTVKDTVYIAKLGANGEPSLWHPSNPLQSSWVYWYKHTALSSARAYHSMYAYNGKMYILGGDTDLSSYSVGALDTVQLADILPNGTLGTWSSGTTMPYTGYGISAQGYNGYLYLMGGNNNGAMVTDTTDNTKARVYYTKLNSDGSMNSWQPANVATNTPAGFATGRASMGGVMSGIWGGYIYVAGGCSAVNTSGNGYCTSIASDVQLASINADGTLDAWNTMANVTHQRFGSSFIAWQDNLYRFGGCSSQATGSATCYATHIDNQYGAINQDGDASTVSISQASGSGSCVDPDPYDCNLPPGGTGAGQAGQALSSAAILNGYLYVIGGCTTYQCTTMSGNTAYAAIDSTGKLKSPPTCQGTKYGAWCVDSTNQVSGGIGAAGSTVFSNKIYLVGGQTGGTAGKKTIYRNDVNADGSLDGAWETTTFSDASLTALNNGDGISYTYVYARANPASAGTNPGNLYIFGGCGDPAAGAGCGQDSAVDTVYKCNIATTGAINTCSTNGQQAIGTPTGGNAAGLAIHAGTVYANYIYLVGGVGRGPSALDLKTVRYAKFDNNNNVVAVSGGAWIESSNELSVGRRRGAAFGYNGYLYVVGGFDASVGGTLKDIQFSKINVSDGSIGAFETSAVTINQRWGLATAVSNSYAYVIGGCKDGSSPTCNSGGLDPTIQTFQVYNNNSGSPGGFTTETDLFGTDRIGASAAVHNGYIYVAGGCVGTTDCDTATDSVQYAQLDAYGGVGSWSTGNSLPSTPSANPRAWGQLEVAGGSLYYIGGQTSTSTDERSEVFYTTGFSAGNPTWSSTAASNGLPAARTKFSATVWNNRIYVVGGLDGSAAVSAVVYISPQLNSGGNITSSWTTGTSLPVARSGATAIAYANNLYVYGGQTSSNYLNDSQFTQINADGSLDSWTYTTSLPVPLSHADGFAVNGYMYLFGGRSSTNDCSPRTLVAPISANTTIASGNNPTGIGEWYETNRKYDTGRYGAAAVYAQGKAYVLGGACQGIVMQDDFDPGIDTGPPSQWSNTTGMTAGTTCQSTSTSNVLYLTTGGTTNQAATKSVNVSSGGTVYFKLYMPLADTGGCFRGEQTTSIFTTTQDNVELEYNNNGAGWNQIGADYVYNTLDPLKNYAVTIPAGAQGTSTQFRWIMRDGEANDSFAIEDVKIIATGNTTLTYTDTKRVQYTSLLSQPQVANYSRLIDAGKDVFPTTWLMNGIDNSIGARWQLNYRSMNDPTVTDANKACGGSAMSAYGQLTNFGDVTLGQPGSYVVRNGAGTDIKCSRYLFMNISIDASQTYGYPDDIARGPTLDNFTLFFRSNPGQRLLHGKTFIEGTQQPLDTACGQSNPIDVDDACPNP